MNTVGIQPRTLSWRDLSAYGLLGLPLAFAALPIYVHVPKLYGDTLGLSLSVVGAVLLATRLLDALVDPLLGWWSDRIDRRKRLIALALPVLAIGMLGLLAPRVEWVGAVWLGVTLTVVYLGFSLAQVNYYAWGAELSSAVDERTRITAWREGFALLGVVAASALPALLAPELAQGVGRLAWLFLPLLAVTAAITLLRAPGSRAVRPQRASLLAAMAATLGNRAFIRLLAVFALNGIASAIPATLVLFFVADVLQLESVAGLFLAIYFIAGVAALPLWVALSTRIGKSSAWLVSMGLACLVFVWAFLLGPGEMLAFALICALSGVALGADLALPPSMLADVMDRDARSAADAKSGAYFGLWNLVTKLNLALAAGIALPLISLLGYLPGTRDAQGVAGLSLVYALVPTGLKLLAAALLSRWMRRL
ncbi:MAG: MFS transporter [Sterolibacteriaceae bacterium]|nr:MFS transporter [Candidatus Methylophosphatis haderslevensis]